MGITLLALLDEPTLDDASEELLDEIRLLLDDDIEELDGGKLLEDIELEETGLEEGALEDAGKLEELIRLDELLLTELEPSEELGIPQPVTRPKGAGWLLQVDWEIQLLLFS